MTKKTVTVVDYDLGNLFSIKHAFYNIGVNVSFASEPEEILKADYLILPGVGSFQPAMESLENYGLTDAIKEFTKKQKPFLGICLGMQLMLSLGNENGIYNGLDIIPGTVEKIPNTDQNGTAHKIPHIGWNKLICDNLTVDWEHTILKGIKSEDYVYFVHSYTANPVNKLNRLADVNYNGRLLSAAIYNNNIYGVQFHPECSGQIGLSILDNFINL